ncbi:hypothetical protein DPMN_025488 [Dreissena polymorpha]|uniref:Uncharacterized protein n=1 Tax=Dreissena polymorpha TaxID=45954 RepID=A0A9D4LR69_DREPO|nr:hypothetical protein DPMN_025488 [Dreissena polymorpha]
MEGGDPGVSTASILDYLAFAQFKVGLCKEPGRVSIIIQVCLLTYIYHAYSPRGVNFPDYSGNPDLSRPGLILR